MLQVKQLLLLFTHESNVYTGRERGAVEPWAPAALRLQWITPSMLSDWANSSFLFPATVILTRPVIKPVCCDTPLISPGADHSIFNSYRYAAPTVDQSYVAAYP